MHTDANLLEKQISKKATMSRRNRAAPRKNLQEVKIVPTDLHETFEEVSTGLVQCTNRQQKECMRDENILAKYCNGMRTFGSKHALISKIADSSEDGDVARHATGKKSRPGSFTRNGNAVAVKATTTAAAVSRIPDDNVRGTHSNDRCFQRNERYSLVENWSTTMDQLTINSWTKSFDKVLASYDSLLEEYNLKDTMSEKDERETSSPSIFCYGMFNSLGCVHFPIFRNCRKSQDTKSRTKKLRGYTYFVRSKVVSCGQQNDNYRQIRDSLSTLRNEPPSQQRNDVEIHLEAKKNDVFLDELRQSPI
ncbi:hypothetical protein HJC23_007521 [Cyclotella cryptica]|uniref:Uncharacterized protein n=1 Tax=Cyclotella cryptica TaxID=29204 RepID=A0ABD3PUH3_9STRA